MGSSHKKNLRKRRRAAVRHAVFTKGPVRLSGGRLGRVKPGRNFRIDRRTVDIPNLPDPLCGLTVAHFSDLHIGELIRPALLPHIVDAVNGLKPDLIAATGDFVDFSNRYLDPIVEAMGQLEATLGSWFVLGNHDYLDDGQAVRAGFESAGLNLLCDRAVRLEHKGCRLSVGGIDWAGNNERRDRDVRDVARSMGECDLSLLLAHHPHAFDAAHTHGIDLTLSGHTHGGQILFSTKRGRKGSIGLGNMGFRYTRGQYNKGDSRLFVSSGVGAWFPVRFRCPAEITLLELQNPY